MGTLNANSMGQVQNTFYQYRTWTTGSWGDSATFDMGYYRGKQYYYTPGGVTTWVTIPPATNAISMANLRSHANTIATATNCACDCTNSCGSTCFPAGSKVLMADGTWKSIELICVGEYVMTPNGPARIWRVDRPVLGTRKMYRMLDHSIYWSSEHSFWVKRANKQWIWTMDRKQLEFEANIGEIGGLKDFNTVFEGVNNHPDMFATIGSNTPWTANIPVHDKRFDDIPTTHLYLPFTEGGQLIFVNGYLVGAGINEFECDYSKLDWDKQYDYVKSLIDHKEHT